MGRSAAWLDSSGAEDGEGGDGDAVGDGEAMLGDHLLAIWVGVDRSVHKQAGDRPLFALTVFEVLGLILI